MPNAMAAPSWKAASTHRRSDVIHRRAALLQYGVRALAVLVLLPLALAWLAGRPGLAQLDMLAYDRMLPLAAHPASPDIVIVAIDEPSLASIGRWPWPRSVHAQLLSRLADAGAAAVLLDVFLSEPSEDAGDDARLAQAMD